MKFVAPLMVLYSCSKSDVSSEVIAVLLSSSEKVESRLKTFDAMEAFGSTLRASPNPNALKASSTVKHCMV